MSFRNEEDQKNPTLAPVLLFSKPVHPFKKLRKMGQLSLRLKEKRRQKVIRAKAFFQRMNDLEAEDFVRREQIYLYEIDQKQKKLKEEKRREEVRHIMEYQEAKRRSLIKLKIH